MMMSSLYKPLPHLSLKMLKKDKWCGRNVLLGLFLLVIVIVVLWQFAELSHRNVVVTKIVEPSTEQQQQQPRGSRDDFHWCSADSSARGPHQKVIAYSLFGADDKVAHRFASLLKNISMTAEKLYPGWIVRIYHNMSDTSTKNEAFTQLQHQQHVDLCGVREMADAVTGLTPIDADLLRRLNGRMFRFLAMLDPFVDIFISRDSDSVIWQREVDAVTQWLHSNFTFHLMRDHKNHSATVLAGMWGVKVEQRRDLIQGLTRTMIAAGQDQKKGTDQSLLDNIVWPSAQYDVMAHDSYHCQNKILNRKSPIKVLPFPTRRNGSYYVGGVGEKLDPPKCPQECRPAYHKDWQYC